MPSVTAVDDSMGRKFYLDDPTTWKLVRTSSFC